ncbi:MAG: hypothetical protein R6U25_10595 [Alkalispirochaeta sp.]
MSMLLFRAPLAPRIPRTVRAILVVCVLLTAHAVSVPAQWQWPVPEDSPESSELRQDTVSPWWRVSGPAADNSNLRTYRFLSSGDVLYHDTGLPGSGGAHTVPRTEDLVIVRHENGFWTFYAGEDLHRTGSSWSQGDTIDTRSTFQAEGAVSFAMYDAERKMFVNPRAVLPTRPDLPEDRLPVVGFLQDGELTLSRNLTAGTAQFVVLEEWLQPLELPRRIFVLVDGLVQAEVDFTFPEEIAERMTPEGHVQLLPLRLDPGLTLVEVESHRFDGSVERRTIPIRVPESVVLDTP